MKEFHPSFWSAAESLENTGIPFVVVTMAGSRGSAPQDPGAKAIVTRDGIYYGTVGGGKIEARCIEEAKKLLTESSLRENPAPVLHTWNLQKDIGMTCGGEASYLFETHHRAHWKIVVFGAGHVAQALARTLLRLRCHLTFVDPRADWMDALPKSPSLDPICMPEPADYVKKLKDEGGKTPYFVVMTRGHASDMPVLKAILQHFPEAPYLGSIGSEVKAIKIRSELEAAGVAPERVKRLRCPIGLKLGGNDPYEIAISVAAELLQTRDAILP